MNNLILLNRADLSTVVRRLIVKNWSILQKLESTILDISVWCDFPPIIEVSLSGDGIVLERDIMEERWTPAFTEQDKQEIRKEFGSLRLRSEFDGTFRSSSIDVTVELTAHELAEALSSKG